MVEVQVRALAETSGGCAAFLGNGEKIFVMLVDRGVGTAIALALQGTPPERPRTHDLIANILRGLDAKVERVIVNDFKRDTYFVRLVVSAQNEVHQRKLIELDARPSDCLALALQQRAPIYVSPEVWDSLEDVSKALRELQAEGSPPEGSDEEETS